MRVRLSPHTQRDWMTGPGRMDHCNASSQKIRTFGQFIPANGPFIALSPALSKFRIYTNSEAALRSNSRSSTISFGMIVSDRAEPRFDLMGL